MYFAAESMDVRLGRKKGKGLELVEPSSEVTDKMPADVTGPVLKPAPGVFKGAPWEAAPRCSLGSAR